MKQRPSKGSEYIISNPSDSKLTHEVVDLSDPPLVSFVIPCYNDKEDLRRCLHSILRQNYPKIEIIVVDNGSEDGSIEIARSLADRVLKIEGSLGAVRQAGFEAATGDIIGSFDSDNYFPHENWIKKAIVYFNYDSDVANVWPKNIAPPDASPFSKLYFDIWENIIEDRIENQRGVFGGGVSLLKKSAIKSVGGIDPDIHWGEDFNLARKLKQQGYKVVYISEPVYHDTDMGDSLVQFTRKQVLGANTFVADGFQETEMSLTDMVYEQIVLGFKGMITGLFFERKIYWIYFPVFIIIRSLSYLFVFIRSKLEEILKP